VFHWIEAISARYGVSPMSKRTTKRKTSRIKKANHGKRPNAGRG
jgi:hypothetical protein